MNLCAVCASRLFTRGVVDPKLNDASAAIIHPASQPSNPIIQSHVFSVFARMKESNWDEDAHEALRLWARIAN